MTNIHIERTHNLGVDKARAQVETLAQSLRDELQADYAWNGNTLTFNRPGASGTIDVGVDYIDVDIEIGMSLLLLRYAIENSVNKRLDALLV